MLKKLDLYIIKKYLSSFFFTVLLITMVAVVIDVSDRIDKFIDQPCTLHEIIFDYYLNFIPWINGLLWPLFAMMAVIFFTSQMAKNSEIISILSAGVSYRRLMVPYLVSASIVAGLLWIGSNYIIPRSTKIKNEFESKYISKAQKKTLSNDVHFYLSPTEKVYIRYYRRKDSSAHTFRHETFDENGELKEILKSSKLKLLEYPNKWQLENYEKRTFNGDLETMMRGGTDKMDTTFNFSPDDFVRHSKQMEMMTTGDLREFIKIERSRGLGTAKKFEVELYKRTADPFTIIILTFLGVIFASRKVRGGMGIHLALGIITGSLYVVLSKFAVTFSNNLSLSPLIGVWIPNIFFGILAIILFQRAQK